MAQKTVVTLVDDLTGEDADQTVEFGLDGVTYEIDLDNFNAGALREAFADYVAAGRRLGRTGTSVASSRSSRTSSSSSRSRSSSSSSGSSEAERARNKKIREWARSEGYEVSERGRIPSDVTDAYARRDH